MSLSKTCEKKADEEETKHEENDGKKCEKEAEDVPSKSVKSSTRKRTTKKADDGASTSQQRRKPSRKNPQGSVGGGNLSKFLCTVDSDVKLNGNDNNNNAETDKPADDDQQQTNDRGAEEGEDAEPSSTTSKPKKIKYVFNSFETGAQCSNNYCNPSSCAYGSDDENVILKLNITNPPAPMGAYATNTASFAARVDDNACSNEGPCAGLTHRDEFLERPLCMFPSEHSLGTDDSNPFKDYYCPGAGAGGAGDPSRGDVVPQGVMGSTEDGAGRHGWVGMCRQPHVVEQGPSGGRSIRLLAEFEEKNKSGEWPANTSVHCYWCCHPFNGPPVGIPAKFVRNKFYLYGCFCSLECAAAYNFHHNGSIDERWRRYSLINLMASKMGHKGGVKQAPDRLTLNIFGGHLNIEAFRSYCKSHHNLTLVNFPPMQAMTQQVEEVNEGDVRCMRPSYIPLDHGRANRAQAKLVLKRNKPLVTGKNTLDRAINLEIQRQPDI